MSRAVQRQTNLTTPNPPQAPRHSAYPPSRFDIMPSHYVNLPPAHTYSTAHLRSPKPAHPPPREGSQGRAARAADAAPAAHAYLGLLQQKRFQKADNFPIPPLVAKMEKMGQAAKEGKRYTTSGAGRITLLLLVLCALASAAPSLAASSLSQTRVRAFEQQNQPHALGVAELTLRLHRGKPGSLVTIRIQCEQLFTGEQFDPESGLYYLRAGRISILWPHESLNTTPA